MEVSSVAAGEPALPENHQSAEDRGDDPATNPSDVPVPDWQKQELDRRKANLTSNPASGLAWDEAKRRIRSRHGR